MADITDGQGIDWIEGKIKWAAKHWLLIVTMLLSLGAGNQCSEWKNTLTQKDPKIDSGLVLLRSLTNKLDATNMAVANVEAQMSKMVILFDSTPTGKKIEAEYQRKHPKSPLAETYPDYHQTSLLARVP